MVFGIVQNAPLDFTELLVIEADENAVQFDALLDAGIDKPLGDAIAVEGNAVFSRQSPGVIGHRRRVAHVPSPDGGASGIFDALES